MAQSVRLRPFAVYGLAFALTSCSTSSSAPSTDDAGPTSGDASSSGDALSEAPDGAVTADSGAREAGRVVPADDGGSTEAGAGHDASSAEDGAAHDASSTDSGAADGAGPRDGGADAGMAPGALGYMVGIQTNSTPRGPAEVEAWLGRPLDIAGTTITTTSYIGSGTPYTTASGAHPLLECSFPLLSIFGESNNLDDMAEAASGAYDATYEAMAQALAAWPNPLLSVRIGWEFNGNWYKWSNGVGTNATYANYVAAFKPRRRPGPQAQPARPRSVERRLGPARPHTVLARRL